MMRNRKTNEKFRCTEWQLWFFYWATCLTQGFKEVKEEKRHKTPVCVSRRVRKWWQPFPTGEGARNQLKSDVLKRAMTASWNWASRWSTGWCWPLAEGRFPRGKAQGSPVWEICWHSWAVSRLCGRGAAPAFWKNPVCAAGAAARAWAHLVLLQGQPFPVPMVLHSLPGTF